MICFPFHHQHRYDDDEDVLRGRLALIYHRASERAVGRKEIVNLDGTVRLTHSHCRRWWVAPLLLSMWVFRSNLSSWCLSAPRCVSISHSSSIYSFLPLRGAWWYCYGNAMMITRWLALSPPVQYPRKYEGNPLKSVGWPPKRSFGRCVCYI